MNRSDARELAFKTIYSKFFNVENNNEEEVDNVNSEFATKIINCFEEHRGVIEELISSHLKGYTLDRVYKIDLAIIMLAVVEIKFIKETPKEVVINEAVELAKKYSTEKSPRFVNGVLADIIK